MKNLLITGGAGFIGSHLVDRLLATGVERITVIDDFNDFYDPSIKRDNIHEHLKDPRYTLSEVDIRDRAALEQTFKANNFDCVVHLAARAGVRPSRCAPAPPPGRAPSSAGCCSGASPGTAGRPRRSWS